MPATAPTDRARDTPEPPLAPRSPAWSDSDLAHNPHDDARKAEKVRRMFAAIAPRYDLNNRLHSFGRDQAWRRVAVREAALRPGDAALDVACGTGDLAFALARAGAARVTGLDFTPEMLEIARRRAGRFAAPATRIDWVEGDAQNLPVPDAAFDVVTIAFGLRNVADPASALAQFRRVLRPKGRLVILEFSRPRNPIIARVNDFYCRRVMPFTATLISRDRSGAYKYLPRSVETFPERDSLVSLIRGAGFDAVTQRPLTFGVCTCYRGVVAA